MASSAGKRLLGTLGAFVVAGTAVAIKQQLSTKAEAPASCAASPWSRKDNDAFLQGTWYNELGSTVQLDQFEDGRLVGNYKTKVESKKGAAGDQPRPLYGNSSPSKKNPTFGFTVVWKESTTSWTGQYYNEKGGETLLTTWILSSKKEDIGDSWGANRVGQDRFYRTKQL